MSIEQGSFTDFVYSRDMSASRAMPYLNWADSLRRGQRDTHL
ncbi:hypothetical protein [Candidatus Marimicrobium litorale]|nr:hypothetical protein [Candidatus Marimicrobium litorale]